MIALLYLVVAAVRLAFSSLKPEFRLRVFFLRFLVAAFGVALAVPAEALMIQYKGSQIFGALVAMLIAIATGEHLIFADLARRQMLPADARAMPLGF